MLIFTKNIDPDYLQQLYKRKIMSSRFPEYRTNCCSACFKDSGDPITWHWSGWQFHPACMVDESELIKEAKLMKLEVIDV